MTTVITGATGTVGRAVAARLAADGRPVRLLSRRPEAAGALAGRRGVETVAVDLGDGPALRGALAGARALLVITADPLRPDHDRNLVEAAGELPERPRLVKLSALAVTDPEADDLITRWQRRNEELVTSSGLPWTLLRPRAFMSNTLSWAADIRARRVVRALGGDARNACVDPRDIAAAAVAALTSPGHDGRAHHLTGPAAISPAEQTDQLGRLLGVPLEYREPSRAEAAERLAARYPEPVVEALLASADRMRAGGKQRVEDGVRAATGREPASFAAWAADHLPAFRPAEA
ncbi:NAD(P)H-binding protein [Streptomyces durbertensis]|uniref:NAD(P)H-binding protein n=1 Tax=Streptomyces durbertensis TaxID=2448886 RepID=A0ABR6EAQ7_9ACTN|nr:NAD(P)H-binding protein [Streptomyces durbertensis]MBB1242424.1 NAD(P)H-binding protein [Streptomyces durbertensis]